MRTTLIILLFISHDIHAQSHILPAVELAGSALTAPRQTPVSVSASGKQLAIASVNPGNVKIVDADTDRLSFTLNSSSRPIKTLRYLPDKQTLLGADDTARIGLR